jgi:hypothetical protein
MIKCIARMEGHSVDTFWINKNSYISYANEFSVKDEKIQQSQRVGNKKFNPSYETCSIRNKESTEGLNIYWLIRKIITPEKSYFILE